MHFIFLFQENSETALHLAIEKEDGYSLHIVVEELCIIFSIYSILSYAIQGAQVAQ
jgi:hypothetical protein